MGHTIIFKDEFTVGQIVCIFTTIRDKIDLKDEIVIDAENITKADVAGVQMLVALKKECIKKGKALTLKISDTLASLMSVIGVEI